MIPYNHLRDPWWRFKHYLRLWLITMAICVAAGWLVHGWDGIIFIALVASLTQVVAFSVWEYGERRRDKQWHEHGWGGG